MNYHVHLGNRNIGVLSLDELRRRRQDGRMTGREYVWREGMPNWQTLDFVLGIRPGAPPPPQKTSPVLMAATVGGVVVLIGCGIAYGIFMARSFQRGFRDATSRNVQASEGSAGVDAARRPIRQTTNTLRESDVVRMQKTFRLRQYAEAYHNLGAHDHPWDADATVFLRAWIDSNFDTDDATNVPDAAKLGDKLAADPTCDDPIVLTAAGSSSVELFEATHRFERALKAFPDSHYKAYPRLYATVMLAANCRKLKQTDRLPPLDKSALTLLKEALQDGSILPEDQPDIAQSLLNGWGTSFFARRGEKICSIVDDAGPPYAWLAGTLRGSHEIELAWKARGSGWANTVTDAGWRGFSDHMAKADQDLSHAWMVHSNWPQAPSQMITVAMAESDVNKMRDWFDRATMAQIDYADAWHNMRWGLRPRWLGSLDAIEALGVAAVDSGRFDTDVPRQFFMSVKDIEEDTKESPGRHIYGRSDIWPKMKQMYEGYIAEPTQAKDRSGWRGCYAIVAYFAQHYDVAREQLAALDWKVNSSTLEGWGTDISLMPLEVAARTGTQASAITRAEAAFRQDDPAEALKLYQKIPAADSDEHAQQFIQHRLASLQLEKQLQAGEWINFLPATTNDLNWTMKRGSYEVSPDGAIEIQSGPTGSMLLSRVRVGIDFEIKGDIEMVRSNTKDFQAGLVLGLPELEDYDWFSFRIKRNSNEGQIAEYTWWWSPTGTKQTVTLNKERNSFDFRILDGKASATVNDQGIIVNAPWPSTARVCNNEFLVGLGAYNDMNETVIRYSNLQLRRLRPGNLSRR